MKSVIFLRSQNPSIDSRLQRYVGILKSEGIPYQILGWNRDNSCVEDNRFHILYKRRAPIGGGLSNIFSLLLWNIFLLKNLFKYRNEYSSIHSVDFDTCIPAYISAKLYNKKFIFDVYDKYTDSRNMPSFIAFFIDKIEKFCCNHCDELILPDICRVKQLGLKANVAVNIIENVPQSNSLVEPNEEANREKSDNIVLAYVGILEKKNRGIENLINVVSKFPNIKLLIAGAGKLENFVGEASQNNENITYYGQVSPDKALEILNQSDIIVGMYYKTIKNHLYASPNKYYEHLFLGKAMLTTEGTPPGDKVLENKTGFAIGETEQDINNFLRNIKSDELSKKKIKAKDLWIEKYKNYNRKLNDIYISLVS